MSNLQQEEDDGHYDVIDTEDEAVLDDSPAHISVYSTSTKDPSRPRTLRAGYDYGRQVMSVVFRDGTWWNYYGVEQNDWDSFRESPSKGEWLDENGYNNRPHGLGPGEMGPAGAGNTATNMMRYMSSKGLVASKRQIQRSRLAQRALGGRQSPYLSGPRFEAVRNSYIKGLGKK